MNSAVKILITGASGFVGRNLLGEAVKRGFEAHALLRDSGKEWRLSGLEGKFFRHSADISDRDSVFSAIKEIKPDYVFHLAAYGSYPFQKEKEAMVKTNILGTMNLLDASLEYGAKAFVNTGSSSEYGIKNEPMKESDILEPATLYAVTKAAATHYSAMRAREAALPLVTLRLFSVYGPFEEKGRLIPTVMLGAATGGLIKLGSPKNARDFVFVGDVVSAYFAVAENASDKKIYGEAINICTGQEKTVGDVAQTVSGFDDASGTPEWASVEGRSYDTASLWVGDGAKAEKLIGWRPERDFKAGLLETFQWFKENKNLYQL